jgi:hypothetical protein
MPKCGWHERTNPSMTKFGSTSRPTSWKRGWNKSSIWQRWQNNSISRKRHWPHKRSCGRGRWRNTSHAICYAPGTKTTCDDGSKQQSKHECNHDRAHECINCSSRRRKQQRQFPPSNSTANMALKPKQAQKPKNICPNCKEMVIHEPELCYELDVNKSSQFDEWVSQLTPTA